MGYEEPSWDGRYFGQFGVLADDGDRVQCHICGDLYAHLGSHTNRTHGLTADQYRRAFGLMQATKLIGPTFRAKRSAISADHLRQYNDIHHGRTRNLTPEQRKALTANPIRRREHELKKTPPERMRAPLKAKYGDPRGNPDEFLAQVVDMFLEELQAGQRGMYRRMGDRMGVDWSVARSRVWSAVRRGHLIWTGDDYEPAGHRPGEQPWHPPGSFEHMYSVLVDWVAEYGHGRVPKRATVGDVRLGAWVQAIRLQYRKGALNEEQVARLEELPGWSWNTRSPAE